MRYTFHAYGHPNILAMHKSTLEFTKEREVSLKGDCIVGVKADFDLNELKKFINKCKNKKVRIIMEANGIKEEISAEINPHFNSDKEMVIRKTDFVSERTFAINSSKVAFELKKDLVEFLINKNSCISISLLNM